MSPQGEVHTVGEWGHSQFARTLFDVDEADLEEQGWVKLSGCNWYPEYDITNAQLSVIVDWYEANGREFNPAHYPTR